MTKYIFVTGGVVSGLGKGLPPRPWGAAARGLRVAAQKLDPYINGTMMSPISMERYSSRGAKQT